MIVRPDSALRKLPPDRPVMLKAKFLFIPHPNHNNTLATRHGKAWRNAFLGGVFNKRRFRTQKFIKK
jgi:hypothetical protein